ncbi:hypothetical protein [Microbacterium sp. LB12]|uniref:hypothetical protein n=1 Tax=Microbacterium sp. LB12 TaxID=3081270 RepID=UPI0030198693
MPKMDTATDQELRALRARAYGPMADIEKDPAALRRLQQLEAMQHAAASGGGSTASPAVVEPEEVRDPEPATAGWDRAFEVFDPAPSAPSDGDSSVPEATSDEPAPRRPLWPASFGSRVVWAAAIAASAAIASAITYGLVSVTPVAASAGAPQIATLEPLPGAAIPPGWMGAGPSSAVFEFYGLTLVETSSGYSYGFGGGTNCFLVIATSAVPDRDDYDSSSGWSIEGPVYSGCAVGVFPSTVEMPIDSNAPKELTTRFPSGGALQFVFDGDSVGVFLDGESM